jgi:hypothetical protein
MQIPTWDYSKPNPEAFNSFAHLLPKAIEAYSKGKKASYLPQQLEAELALKKAQGNLTGEQAKYYGQNVQSQMGLRAIQQQLAKAQAGKSSAEANQLKMMMDFLNNPEENDNQDKNSTNPEDVNFNPQESSPGFQNVSNDSLNIGGYDFNNPNSFQEGTDAKQIAEHINSNPSRSAWGIDIPKLSKEDMRNKLLFKTDTYTPSLKQAIENQNLQQKGYIERSVQNNNEANAATDYNQLLDRYNNAMDRTLLAGPYKSKFPLTTSETQEIDNLSEEMRKTGIRSLQNAMHNARFSNLDMQIAGKLKPDRTWTPEARHFYTEFTKAINHRLLEKAKFYQLAGNPKMGLSYNDADSLWRAYNENHPIVKSEKSQELNEYKDNNWMSYLTPKAIKSIKFGTYNPRDKGLIPPLDVLKAEREKRNKSKRA